MPDTHVATSPALPVFEAPAVAVAGPSILDGYRSAHVGKLVAARAKATAGIKTIIKDKTATVPTKTGGTYKYAYADLADVLDAVADALAEHELVLLQVTQARASGTFLVTTLLHSSDQWMASEIRLNAIGNGPQVHGSEMTYLRRYQALAVLGIAPEQDDDGAAAQDRADAGRHRQGDRHSPRQEARQIVQDRTEPPRALIGRPGRSGATGTARVAGLPAAPERRREPTVVRSMDEGGPRRHGRPVAAMASAMDADALGGTGDRARPASRLRRAH
jgi:hypothetical protein